MSLARLGALTLFLAILIGGGIFLTNKLVGSAWTVGGGPVEGNISTDPAFILIVDLPETTSNQQSLEKQIATAILDNFHQRGLKPKPGMRYRIEATVTRDEGPELSIPLDGRPIKMPSEKLVCTLTLKFKDKILYEKSKDILADQSTMMYLAGKKPGTFTDEFEKLLWKNVVPQFQALAEGAPTSH